MARADVVLAEFLEHPRSKAYRTITATSPSATVIAGARSCNDADSSAAQFPRKRLSSVSIPVMGSGGATSSASRPSAGGNTG